MCFREDAGLLGSLRPKRYDNNYLRSSGSAIKKYSQCLALGVTGSVGAELGWRLQECAGADVKLRPYVLACPMQCGVLYYVDLRATSVVPGAGCTWRRPRSRIPPG